MFGTQLDEVFRRSEAFSISRWIVNGTSPADWKQVAELTQRNPGVTPQFGIHPWESDQVPDNWETQLKELLLRFPQAGLGEIGLDRKLTQVPIDIQKEICRVQLQVAAEYQRPCTLHIVGAWQEFDQLLAQLRPARMLLHAFGGSVEQMKHYMGAGTWFSVGGAVLRENVSTRYENMIQSIPDDHLLLETDSPYQHPDGRKYRQEPAGLLRVAERVARIRQIPVDRLRVLTEQNADRFLRSQA